MLLKELKKLKLQNEMISIERDSGKDIRGTIEFVNKEIIVICEYLNTGHFDGYSVFFTDRIDNVSWGHRDDKALALTVAHRGKKNVFKASGKTFPEIMADCSQKYSSLEIYPGNDDDDLILATIIEQGKDWLKLHSFGGRSCLSQQHELLKVESINRIAVDSMYQNNIVELHDEDL